MIKKEYEGFDIISYDDIYVTIRCKKCGAIRIHNHTYSNIFKHGQCCSTYYKELIINSYGKRVYEVFSSKYRGAKNRVLNPNNKDYFLYGKYEWGFEDFEDFMFSEFNKFIDASIKYGVDNLSIDRINGNFGYIKGNIRFIPMDLNLKNKDTIKPVKVLNINTGEEYEYENPRVCGLSLNINPSRVWECCNRDNHIYKNKYYFSYK